MSNTIGHNIALMEQETFGFQNLEQNPAVEVCSIRPLQNIFSYHLGIVVYDRLDDMLKLCTSTVTDKAKFIVQKYIERPLLIHNVKFDIRQWFLVTDWNPLTIWMYKDCYLRFCTEYFSLATRQQNVHLCNHAIQKHYKNNATRHSDLPRTICSTCVVNFCLFGSL